MIEAGRVADALERIVNGNVPPLGPKAINRIEILADVLASSLDEYALARLWCVATFRLGRSEIPAHPGAYLAAAREFLTPTQYLELIEPHELGE